MTGHQGDNPAVQMPWIFEKGTLWLTSPFEILKEDFWNFSRFRDQSSFWNL
jgi:hypothetical protein